MMTDTGKMIALGVGLGLIALGGLYIASRQARQAAAAVGAAVNPLSTENVFYAGTGAVVGAIVAPNTPAQDFSLGAWFWELTHPGQVRAEEAAVRASIN
jgi:hypothetical protein